MGGAIIFLALFPQNYISLHFLVLKLMTSQRKLYMVGIRLTVEKQAKRTPDIIVETTATHVKMQLKT